MGWFSDLVSGVGDIAGGLVSGVGDLAQDVVKTAAPLGGIIGAATGIPGGAAIGSVLGNALSDGSGAQAQTASGVGSGGYGVQPIIINNTPQSQQQQGLFSQMLPFLLQAGGGLVQGQVNKEAAQTQADALRAAGQQAATAAQFRPVGTTTRFGTSNFQVDPVTGQLTSAGYTSSELAKNYQDLLAGMTSQGLSQGQAQQQLASQYLASQQGQPITALGTQLMGSQAGQPLTSLGQQYLGESPEAIRQRYVQQQTSLLAPQQEQQLAGIRNQLFQTGRGGLATGATSAGNLAATNPELAAYYNSLANQQRQIAAGADAAAQQQAQFGAGLLSQGTGLTQGQQLAGAGLYGTGLGLTQQGQQFGQQLGASAFNPFTAGFGAQTVVEQASQQPLSLSSELAKQFQQANATGGLYNLNAQNAAANAVLRANQVSPFADILSALGKVPAATSAIGGAASGLLGGLLGGSTQQQTQSTTGLGDLINLSGILNPSTTNTAGFTDVFNLDSVDPVWF